MKIRNLLNEALQTAGVVANNESAVAEDLAVAYNILNNLIDLWASQKRLTWTKLMTASTLTAGSFSNINLGTIPLSVDKVVWSYTNDNNSIKYEIPQVDIEDALLASNKMTGVPRAFAWDGRDQIDIIGRGTTVYVSIAYTPKFISSSLDYEFELSSYLQFGYNTALKYNIALLLCEEFGKTPSPTLVAMATQTLEAIKPQNKRPAISRCETGNLFRTGISMNGRNGDRYI